MNRFSTFVQFVNNSIFRNSTTQFLYLSIIYYIFLVSVFLFGGYKPGHDSLYYWQWSQHLSINYFDGPLGIAYYIKVLSLLLGSSLTAVVLSGFISIALLSLLVYFFARILFGSKVGYLAAAFFLVSPLTLGIYAFQITYDTPACFFSLLTLICFYQFHVKRQLPYLYLCALFGLCMMLSKYTGAVLFFSLIVLVFTSKPYRHFLKNIHTYISLVLTLVVFIIVYFQSLGQGINPLSFQLMHAFSYFSFTKIKSVFGYVLFNLLAFNSFLICFAMLFFRYKKKLIDAKYLDQLDLIFTYAFFIFFFYMVASISNYKPNWNILFYNVVPVGLAFYSLISKSIRKVLFVTSLIYAILGILTALFVTNLLTTKKLQYYNSNYNEYLLVRELRPFLKKTNYIVCDDYRMNSILKTYLNRQVNISSYSWAGHEYKLWGRKTNRMLKDNIIPHFIYLSKGVKPSFGGYACHITYKAHFKLTNTVIFGGPKWTITVYQCLLTKLQK